jgi:capsular exopolysaccharide synthesis family protein
LLPAAAAGAGAGYSLEGVSPVVAGGAAIGLVPAAAAGLAIDLRGHKLRTAADIERRLDLETMGIIGRFEQSPGSAFPREDEREALQAYKELAASLRASGGHDLRTVLVTSAGPEEGKSTTAANLATVLAQTGSKVVLVDADLRWSSLRSTNANASSLGLSGLLLNYLHTPQLAVVRTNEHDLFLLPAGVLPPNPQELLALPRLADIIASLREIADYVIFDSPPLLEADDAKLLAQNVDATLLVTLAGKTRSRTVNRALSLLDDISVQPIGVVLNRVKTARPALAPAPRKPAVQPEAVSPATATAHGPTTEAASATATPQPVFDPFTVDAFRKGPPRPIGANMPRLDEPEPEPAILRIAKEGLQPGRAIASPADAGYETPSQAQRMAALRNNLRLIQPDERPVNPPPVDDWLPVPPPAPIASPGPAVPIAAVQPPAAPQPQPSPTAVPPHELSVDEVLTHMEETLRLIREMRKEKVGDEAARL